MYRILGGDQKEYGPVNADEVRRWITERRLQANSLVQVEGTTGWKPLSLFPEFSSTLASANPPPAPAALPSGILTEQRSNSMATTGLVMSCFSLICCGCGPVAILGIVFSCIGLAQANRDPAQSGRPIAIAGIVIGIVALLGTVVGFALGLFGNLLERITQH